MFQRLVCSLACIVCNFVFLCFCFHFVSFQSTVHTELFHLFADFESARGVLADDFYFHCSTYFFPCICQHSSFICFLFQRVSCFLFIFIPPFILPTSISGLHASFFFFFFLRMFGSIQSRWTLAQESVEGERGVPKNTENHDLYTFYTFDTR